MTTSRETRGPEPDVYARLSEQQERQFAPARPPWWAKGLGWLLVAAITASVVVAALEVRPW